MNEADNVPATPKVALRRTPPFPPRPSYSSLSVRDLIEAREAYHVHLSSLENVVGTAIGRYLIRRGDWYENNPPDARPPDDRPRITAPRTFSNSVVRPWSWPSVLVLVRRWDDLPALGRDAVPRTLHLPDGRVIPTCVVLATPDEAPSPPILSPSPASTLLGGGYACLRRHQGTISAGTLACLARKDGAFYALTNRHVAGGDGEQVEAFLRGDSAPIGRASGQSVGRVAMATLFARWPVARTYLMLDAGLIRVDNVEDWTSQVFGIGEVGELFDATEQSVTLDLIGLPVRAFGGTSGVMEGQIQALFFRYQSLGGDDHATDLLIGPRWHEKHEQTLLTPLTRPGDSGTLWFYDPPDKPGPATAPNADVDQGPIRPERPNRARRLRPLAMQWGGERIKQPDGTTSAFALASFLSSICRTLDVEVVRNWSLGHDEYWGKIGHFAIGWKACDRVHGALGTLMQANQVRIGFGNARLEEGSEFRMGRGEFVPLSDVPDYVWIMSRRNAHEGIQHFGDIDIHDIDGGPALLDACIADPRNVAASVWQRYFAGFAGAQVGPEEGTLPLRVWQIWDEMVRFLRAGDVRRFVTAAGILAHYVGDASQPLHGSYLHHGRPPMRQRHGRRYPFPRDHQRFQEFKETRRAKIHSVYEQTMLEIEPGVMLRRVDETLAGRPDSTAPIARGHDAAVATIRLMHDARTRLSPLTIIDADHSPLGPKARATRLWENAAIREPTITCVADSVLLLARLWETAWTVGGGANIAPGQLRQFREDELDPVYRDPSFLRGMDLAGMVASGRFEAP